MAIKLFSEAAAAWAAVILAGGGGLLTTAIHYGSTNQQIQQIQAKQADTDAHVAKHDDQLSVIQQQSARIEQKLDDVASDVRDVKSQVHKR